MQYLPFVNIKQGSDSVHSFSNGNTLPLTQLPFAMAGFAPQTQSQDSWFYSPRMRVLEGVRLTHQPSPWIADYGTVIFMPQKRTPQFSPVGRRSGFRPEAAVLQPHFLHLEFLKSRSIFELVPTERCGMFTLQFDDAEDNWLSVLPLKGGFTARFVSAENTLYVTVDNCSGDNTKNFKEYAVIVFGENEICAEECIFGKSGGVLQRAAKKIGTQGVHLKLQSDRLTARVGISYIGFDQAKENLRQDTQGKSFVELKKEGEALWESYLSRVEIEAFDERQKKTFYSCMYRAFLYPHKAYELTSDGKPVHYAPHDGKVYPGVRYTDNGFWDTYRTCYPFYALVARDEYREMVRGFVNDYLECGWLPRWPSIGERGCMPSTLIDAVLCDAAVKGLMDRETMEQALEGMLKHANTAAPNDDYGRSGVLDYLKYGYVPIESHIESVNLTLDAAYGDWCIARIAEALGKTTLAAEYDRRAENYKTLFDPETGFMRPRFINGDFRPDFSPVAWGRDYTEGSAWQNSFAVPHDIEGLASLYGGREKLIEKIDALFATLPVYENVGYGAEIHEMTEMAAADFGQCAISNQPSFHIPYIYAALGDVEKSSYWVEKICREAFSYEDDGFPGDEDNGSMALWYVFACIGIYPFCPGKNEYVRTKKLVRSVKILGKPFDADSFSGNTVPYESVRIAAAARTQ
ncbi:MAG: GH92 family glycosyl hydrolase [Clostridia bacterium]|nr:GH92 family glycosyl hydrolase [Clostridia bacterium]